ncbi:Lipoprotein [Flavobacterium branchiophilum]|nr:hypothetical protein [Flavobacterium branchiophilum]CCB70210.1 Hypothetical lipoprotein precursor [Flavobacterium branchiophilum FL-15]
MRKLIFVLLFLFISCSKKEINYVLIQNDKSSEINLFKGIYKVHFMDKQDGIYNFSIKKQELFNIKETYNNENIIKYGKEFLVIDEKTKVMPSFDVKYVIGFTSGDEQVITIRSDFRQNPLDNEKYKNLKVFIDKINNIIKSKEEINKAEKSNALYF